MKQNDNRWRQIETLLRDDNIDEAKRLIWPNSDQHLRRQLEIESSAARQQRLERAARGSFNQFFVGTHRAAFDGRRVGLLESRSFLDIMFRRSGSGGGDDDDDANNSKEAFIDRSGGKHRRPALVTIVAVCDGSQSESTMLMSLETLLYAGEMGNVPIQLVAVDTNQRLAASTDWPRLAALASALSIDLRLFGHPAKYKRTRSMAAETATLINSAVAAEATGERLLLWDLNAMACTKTVQSMLDALDEHGNALAVARVVQFGSGRLVSAANAFSEQGRVVSIGIERYGTRPYVAALSFVRQVDFSLAMYIMIDAYTFAALGGLNDASSPTGALIDLQLRATYQRGLPVLYVPQATAFQISDSRMPFSGALSMNRDLSMSWANRVTSATRRGVQSRHTLTDRLRELLPPHPHVNVLVVLANRQSASDRVLPALLARCAANPLYRFTLFFVGSDADEPRTRADDTERQLDRGPLQLAGIQVLTDQDVTSLEHLSVATGFFYDIAASDAPLASDSVASRSLAPLHINIDELLHTCFRIKN